MTLKGKISLSIIAKEVEINLILSSISIFYRRKGIERWKETRKKWQGTRGRSLGGRSSRRPGGGRLRGGQGWSRWCCNRGQAAVATQRLTSQAGENQAGGWSWPVNYGSTSLQQGPRAEVTNSDLDHTNQVGYEVLYSDPKPQTGQKCASFHRSQTPELVQGLEHWGKVTKRRNPSCVRFTWWTGLPGSCCRWLVRWWRGGHDASLHLLLTSVSHLAFDGKQNR